MCNRHYNGKFQSIRVRYWQLELVSSDKGKMTLSREKPLCHHTLHNLWNYVSFYITTKYNNNNRDKTERRGAEDLNVSRWKSAARQHSISDGWSLRIFLGWWMDEVSGWKILQPGQTILNSNRYMLTNMIHYIFLYGLYSREPKYWRSPLYSALQVRYKII
jgi:hypothetical protein